MGIMIVGRINLRSHDYTQGAMTAPKFLKEKEQKKSA
jgi:hypothetical protein